MGDVRFSVGRTKPYRYRCRLRIHDVFAFTTRRCRGLTGAALALAEAASALPLMTVQWLNAAATSPDDIFDTQYASAGVKKINLARCGADQSHTSGWAAAAWSRPQPSCRPPATRLTSANRRTSRWHAAAYGSSLSQRDVFDSIVLSIPRSCARTIFACWRRSIPRLRPTVRVWGRLVSQETVT